MAYAAAVRVYKGAVQLDYQGNAAADNVVYLFKGAVQPLTDAGAAASIVGWLYPRDGMPTDEQRFQDFIDAVGLTPTGCLVTDMRNALCEHLGLSPYSDYNIMDAAKRYDESL